MDLRNVSHVVLNLKLPNTHTCGCGRSYDVFPAAYICKYGLIYADCECLSTMTIAPKKYENGELYFLQSPSSLPLAQQSDKSEPTE